jgi:hypothetical protein
MSKYFKSIDIFGNSFSFTTFQQDKYKTTVGGFFSLICIVIAIVFSFLFGKDFFYRTNPKVRSQKVIPEFAEKINLTRDVLALPWRIEDDAGKPMNFDGLIYPKLSYYFYNYNEQNQLALTKKIYFNLTKCSEENVKFPQLYKQLNLSNYYCFDWEASDQKYTFGGFWDASFAHYFEINFDFCKERQYIKSNNCTSIEKLKSYFSSDNPWYFSAFYPQFTFSNEDLETPLKLVFKNYYYQFNLNSQKTDRWKFKQVILDDDQGWILPSNKNTSVISYDRIDNDFSLVLDDDLTKEGSKSTFYKTVFYLEKDFDIFNRSFMKVQDLAAVVGGFLKIILVIFGFISSLFNKNFRKIHLFYEMFECDFLLNEAKDQDNTNNKNSKTYKFSSNNLKNSINNTAEIPLPSRISIRGNFNRNNNLSPNLRNNQIDDKKLTKLENKTNFLSKPEKKNSTTIDQSTNNHNKIQSKFGMLFLIKKTLCVSMLTKEERQFYDILLLTNKYFNIRLDVITYIRTLDTFDRIKSLLFNHYQNNSLNFIKKPKISSEEDLDALEINLTEDKSKIIDLVEYYNKLTRTHSLSNIDKQLLPLLNDEIQRQIVKN